MATRQRASAFLEEANAGREEGRSSQSESSTQIPCDYDGGGYPVLRRRPSRVMFREPTGATSEPQPSDMDIKTIYEQGHAKVSKSALNAGKSNEESGPSVGITSHDASQPDFRHYSWDMLGYHIKWDDASCEAELEKTELVRNVFTYELMNSNATYRRYIQGWVDAAASIQHREVAPPVESDASRLTKWWHQWKNSELRYQVYMTLTHAEFSKIAWAINIIIIALIITGTITFCLQSIPDYERSSMMDGINITDYICLAAFTIEFMLRLLTCPRLWHFIKTPMNIIDFLAVFPFYVELMVVGQTGSASQTRVLRLVRLLRVLRLLRLWNRFQHLTVVVDALVSSFDVLGMLAFLLVVILIVFSTIIYYIEGKVEGSTINSIPQAMYYVQTTLTTTGYGDVVPQTYQGKAVIGLLMLFAIVTLALPISVIGANFTNMWTDYKTMKRAAERSAKVWSNFREINKALDKHRGVLDDVMQHCKEGQNSIDEDVTAVREAAQKVRVMYLVRTAKGQSTGWEQDLTEMRDLVAVMKARLTQAKDKWEELEAVMSVSAMTRADDFLLKLDRMHVAYKNLRKWFEEGVYMLQEVSTLSHDCTLLKQHMHQEAGQQ